MTKNDDRPVVTLTVAVEAADRKMVAMEAMMFFIEAERALRPQAEELRTKHPEIWSTQIAGVAAELGNPDWEPFKMTLDPLIKMVSPYQGTNPGVLVLPYFRDEYDRICEFRNAIAHGDWEDVNELGGPDYARALAFRFLMLVQLCTGKEDWRIITKLSIIMGGTDWEWPPPPADLKRPLGSAMEERKKKAEERAARIAKKPSTK